MYGYDTVEVVEAGLVALLEVEFGGGLVLSEGVVRDLVPVPLPLSWSHRSPLRRHHRRRLLPVLRLPVAAAELLGRLYSVSHVFSSAVSINPPQRPHPQVSKPPLGGTYSSGLKPILLPQAHPVPVH